MAKVIKPFRGVPDGQSRVQDFKPGDEVTGDLAAVAVREGWAEEVKAAASALGAGDGDLGKLTVAQLEAMADELGVDLAGARRKADIVATIAVHQAA